MDGGHLRGQEMAALDMSVMLVAKPRSANRVKKATRRCAFRLRWQLKNHQTQNRTRREQSQKTLKYLQCSGGRKISSCTQKII